MISNPVIAAIDAGGTSFKCALVSGDGTILSAWRIPTQTPETTLDACAQGFKAEIEKHGVSPIAIGIASFGPVDIDPTSANYGTITGTAKPVWSQARIGPALSAALRLPFHLETDVNAALAAEMIWGTAKNADSAAYMTIGTGIGVGLFLNGAMVGRPSHPEFGHIRVARHARDLDFEGVCAIHGDCLEGLASANAMHARWGDPARLPSDHIGWEIEAYYLAQACLSLYLMTRTDHIILGGGLMQAGHLLDKVRDTFDQLVGDYLPVKGADVILSPGLGEHAGVLGGAVTALNALS